MGPLEEFDLEPEVVPFMDVVAADMLGKGVVRVGGKMRELEALTRPEGATRASECLTAKMGAWVIAL